MTCTWSGDRMGVFTSVTNKRISDMAKKSASFLACKIHLRLALSIDQEADLGQVPVKIIFLDDLHACMHACMIFRDDLDNPDRQTHDLI